MCNFAVWIGCDVCGANRVFNMWSSYKYPLYGQIDTGGVLEADERPVSCVDNVFIDVGCGGRGAIVF